MEPFETNTCNKTNNLDNFNIYLLLCLFMYIKKLIVPYFVIMVPIILFPFSFSFFTFIT